jgi:signal peptidase I
MHPNRRKPWLAALLSLPLAGLGHLYAGSPRRAVAFFSGELVTTLVWLFLVVSWPFAPWNMIVGAAVTQGWNLVSAVSAYRYTAREPARTGRPAWIRWPAYAVVYIAAHYGPALALRATAFEAFVIPTRSMSDTLIPGDRLLATKWTVGSPERGQLVVFRMPAGKPWVKRVIGLPGDRVEVRAGIAFVNGEPLAEPYVRLDGTDRGGYGPTVVPPASFFVLGDNRNLAKDSRVEEVGFVREGQIFARPRAIFWSVDPATFEIRWDRLGRPLR